MCFLPIMITIIIIVVSRIAMVAFSVLFIALLLFVLYSNESALFCFSIPTFLFFVLFSEGREDEVWSLRGCCPPSHRTCSECCSCACCACPPRPFPRSQSLRLDSIPLNQLGNRSHSHHHRHPPSSQHYCELESQFYHQQRRQSSSRVRVRRHPLIPSKTVVDPPWRSNSFTFPDNKKSNSVACLTDARLICREKLLQAVPNKLSSTGVRVLYVCDVPLEAETNKTGTQTRKR